ncbi:MAG TPA: NAD-dependent epimerase/dehydratase family protein [Candidatus Limnocylindrales bacterium]|nr:NAD-dependent epimerase/dehydratase family protein [Candidatus Limnocylindrales bacterium]
MKVLVTGGAGFLGRATVRELVEAGHTARIVSRDAWPSGSLFEKLGVEVVVGDAQQRAVIDRALEGVDALVQAAATYRYDRKAGPSMANNAALARTILEAAHNAGTRKVVDISSLVVFALGHSPVTESTPLTKAGDPGWSDPYLRSKVECELVGEELEQAGLPRVTIHPGTVIGPEDTAMGTSSGFVTNLLAGGIAVDSRAPWVDVRDVAKAIVLALDKPVGSHYLLTSGVATHREVGATLDNLTGRTVKRQFLAAGTVRRLAKLNDLFGGRLSPLPASSSIDWILDNAAAVDTSRTQAELGMEFRPLRATLADTIRWWAEHDMVDRELAGRLAPPAR